MKRTIAPEAAAAAPAVKETAAPLPADGRINILIVDDQTSNLDALEAVLDAPDYNLTRATSAQECLLALLKADYAAIILDIRMPGVSGLELAQLIKQRKRTEHVPILFLTAHLLEEQDVLRGYGAGAVDYLSKPINPEILRSKVAVFADLYRKTRALAAANAALEARTAELEDSNERLRLSERMAMIGTLASGIGHDIANLIMPIRLCVDSLAKKALPEGTGSELQSIRTSVDYLQSLAKGLRMLALDPNRRYTAGDSTKLDEWWKEVEPLLRAVASRNISLQGVIPGGAPALAIGRHQLTQAVFNLVQNAADVLRGHEDGKIKVSVRMALPGWVVVEVSDNGPGMTDEVRRRCLEPFFTTKSRGLGGTGMGLTLVHGIVRAAGGSIEIDSSVGSGSCFSLKLPSLLEADSLAPKLAAVRPHAVLHLDDVRLRAYTRAIIEETHQVVEPPTGNGRAALWITGDETEARLASGLDGGEAQADRVIFFGDALVPTTDNLLAIGVRPKPSVIREVLKDVCAEQVKMTAVLP
jgi:signal transduction histidine kinase